MDTKDATCSCECAGVITAVADDVSEFEIGDRVVAMAPSHFATVERLPEWAVLKLRDEEDFTVSDTSVPANRSSSIYTDSLHNSAGILNGHLCTASSGKLAARRSKHCIF